MITYLREVDEARGVVLLGRPPMKRSADKLVLTVVTVPRRVVVVAPRVP